MEPDTVTEEKPGAMSAEQAADFAAIQAGAAGQVAEPVAGQVQEQGQQPPTAQALGVAAMVLGVARPLLCHMVKGLDTAPDALWEPVTDGVAGLIDHYGLARPELQGPWARFAVSVIPLAGMVVIHQMQNPEPEPMALEKSSIYQVPGKMPEPVAEEGST